jgi:hypothetical protein
MGTVLKNFPPNLWIAADPGSKFHVRHGSGNVAATPGTFSEPKVVIELQFIPLGTNLNLNCRR